MEAYKARLKQRRDRLLHRTSTLHIERRETIHAQKKQKLSTHDDFEEEITDSVDVLETDKKKINKPKTSGFLVTINTNKNKAVISTELLSTVADNDEGEYGYTELCKKVEEEVLRVMKLPEFLVPKLYKAKIDPSLYDDIRKFIFKIDAEPGAWEESEERNGRKIHIHMTLKIMYSGRFVGYFHLDAKKLGAHIRSAVPELSWGKGPYIQIRFIKEASQTVAQYIHKELHKQNTTLYERNQEIIEERIRKREDEKVALLTSILEDE